MPCITLVNLKKKFGDTWVTNGVNLTIPSQELTVIIGRSGEGKSVLLKQIIGLIPPTSGEIIIDNIPSSSATQEEFNTYHREMGYVFQFAALLDSLTIFENIGITLLEKDVPKEEVLSLVKEKLALVNLEQDTLYKYPSELSGGMRKRAGLARTLITNPKIILYDEPTTGLDPITTRIIHELMVSMQKKLHLTSVIISHDIDIFNYVDNVALLHEGIIKYFGPAKTIWECDNPYVYQFIRGLSQGPIEKETVRLKDTVK